jgi:DNA-binding NarL/FixJ family response regulator
MTRRGPGEPQGGAPVNRGREPVRVLVVDDQELVRAGFVALLRSDAGIVIAGEAADGAEAVELARGSAPQVVLMDVRMPVMDGISATRELRALPDPPEVIILTTFDTDEYAYQAFRAGACGFLVKDTPPVELLRAVHQTAAGGTVISPPTARRLLRDLAASRPGRRPTPQALQALTERELEVLQLVARGHSNREIARELVISELTAKTHVSRILTKLNLISRVHAVVFAYETGLITPGGD